MSARKLLVYISISLKEDVLLVSKIVINISKQDYKQTAKTKSIFKSKILYKYILLKLRI